MAAVTTAVVAASAAATAYSADQARKASKDAARAQTQAGRESISYQEQQAERGLGLMQQLDPVAQRGLEASSFLADPAAQYEFLQENPIFQQALDEARSTTLARASAGGRLGAGDTKSELARNVLLSSLPLIDRQRQDVGNLLNVAQSGISGQANILQGLSAGVSPVITDIGAARAGGIMGANQATQQGIQNMFGIFGQMAGGGAFGKDLQGAFG